MTETCLYSFPSRVHTMQKKQAHYSLIREIRRLRTENSSLHNSITLLKSDLQDATQSRQEMDVTYKKIYDEIANRNHRLEIELADKNEEIENLKRKLENSPRPYAFHDAAYFKKHSNILSFEQDDDDETHFGDTSEFTRMEDSDNDEEDEEQEPFESFIPSYLHQAILSKLTSARVRLELDDYMMKYEASQSTMFTVLATSFIDWLNSKLQHQPEDEKVSKLFMTHIQTGIAGFWQEIFCYFAHDAPAQYMLLKDIEYTIHAQQGKMIAQHFHHLLLMLYKHQIIDDEAAILWWQDPCDNEMSKKMRDITLKFVNWIQDSDEEDEEEVEYSDDDEIHVHFEHDFIHFEHEHVPHDDDADDPSGEDTDDAMLESHSLHHLLSNLLINSESCICQFTIEGHTVLTASTFDNNVLTGCSCKYMSQPAVEKKDKSVRIAM